MTKLIFSLCCFTLVYTGYAQDFISSGKITYERKMNIWANVSENYFENFKSVFPEWITDEFTLLFFNSKSLYKPKQEIKKTIATPPANDNIVYTDLDNGRSISFKSLFEKNYLIESELRHATWKIKDDFREIAGYNCRRATTMLFDSVFVVAFYTDKIIPSTGPESFHGLPGTILGLVINRLHTSWYATKVEEDQVNEKEIVPPVKGTRLKHAEFDSLLPELTKSFGNAGQQMIWFVDI